MTNPAPGRLVARRAGTYEVAEGKKILMRTSKASVEQQLLKTWRFRTAERDVFFLLAWVGVN